jgi:hypothetical protein
VFCISGETGRVAIQVGAGERSGEISRGIETYSSISAFAELESDEYQLMKIQGRY